MLLHEQVRGILGTRRSSNGDDNGLKLAGNQRLRHQHIDLENSRDPSWRRTGVLDFGIDTTHLHTHWLYELGQRTRGPKSPIDARWIRIPTPSAKERNYRAPLCRIRLRVGTAVSIQCGGLPHRIVGEKNSGSGQGKRDAGNVAGSPVVYHLDLCRVI